MLFITCSTRVYIKLKTVYAIIQSPLYKAKAAKTAPIPTATPAVPNRSTTLAALPVVLVLAAVPVAVPDAD